MSVIKIMAALAVRAPFDRAIVPAFAARGYGLDIAWAPTTIIMERIAAGDRADLVVLIKGAMDRLVTDGVVEAASRIEVVESRLGVAVLDGAPAPDISSEPAFVQSLLAARSVAYSASGTSGLYFKGLIERLGIAEALNAKATITPSGFTAEMLVSGAAELAVQQVSELMVVPGVTIVGRFPDALQQVTAISAARFAGSEKPAALEFLALLRSEMAMQAYAACGLDPV
jgi:molybdate transport system substrate-binding protein